MTLPLMPIRAGGHGGCRLAGSVLLVVLVLSLSRVPGWAADADPYSATVAVDATADSVVKAREMARADGQRRALAAVAERLSGGNLPPKLAKLDDQAITNLVVSFEVADEHMSAVRYVADYTFHFRADEIRRMLGNGGTAAAADSSRPPVVVPVYQSDGRARLWEDPNPWRQAWDKQPAAGAARRLAVPLGDAGDIAAIDAAKAQAGDADALAAIARHNGGDEVIVAQAVLRGPPDGPSGLDVTVRRYQAGRLIDTHVAPFDANPGEAERALLGRAVAAIGTDIGNGWKNEAAAHNDQEGRLTAILPIASLDDWVLARERLGAVPAIHKIALMALSRDEATIEIGYGGSIDELKAGLAGTGLNLVGGDPKWRLARSGPARLP